MDEPKKTSALPNGLTQEALDTLKRAHGELQELKTDGTSIIVRQPSLGEWERFQERIDADPKSQFRALRELLGVCVVFPDPAGLEAIFSKRPAWIKKFGIGLVTFAAGEDATEKNVL